VLTVVQSSRCSSFPTWHENISHISPSAPPQCACNAGGSFENKNGNETIATCILKVSPCKALTGQDIGQDGHPPPLIECKYKGAKLVECPPVKPLPTCACNEQGTFKVMHTTGCTVKNAPCRLFNGAVLTPAISANGQQSAPSTQCKQSLKALVACPPLQPVETCACNEAGTFKSGAETGCALKRAPCELANGAVVPQIMPVPCSMLKSCPVEGGSNALGSSNAPPPPAASLPNCRCDSRGTYVHSIHGTGCYFQKTPCKTLMNTIQVEDQATCGALVKCPAPAGMVPIKKPKMFSSMPYQDKSNQCQAVLRTCVLKAGKKYTHKFSYYGLFESEVDTAGCSVCEEGTYPLFHNIQTPHEANVVFCEKPKSGPMSTVCSNAFTGRQPKVKAAPPMSCHTLGIKRQIVPIGSTHFTVACVIWKHVFCATNKAHKKSCASTKETEFLYADTCLRRTPDPANSVVTTAYMHYNSYDVKDIIQPKDFNYTECVGKSFKLPDAFKSKDHCVTTCVLGSYQYPYYTGHGFKSLQVVGPSKTGKYYHSVLNLFASNGLGHLIGPLHQYAEYSSLCHMSAMNS